MIKKIFVAILLITVIGAGAAVVVSRANGDNQPDSANISPLIDQQVSVQSQQNSPQVTAGDQLGQPWQSTGLILELDENGIILATEDGDEVYIELGPADYWQSQGIDFERGMQIFVEGIENDGLIHATKVTLQENQELQLRTDLGQPMWSGGINQGQNANQANGIQNPEPQAQVTEWITINGTILSYQGSKMTVSADNGDIIVVQAGQPRFFSSQGVTFTVGDAISLVGYMEGDQFVAGEITQTATGLRVMLRDPNGRPLWAGPGNGAGNGKGNNGNNQ